MQIVITGVTGSLGRALLRQLIKRQTETRSERVYVIGIARDPIRLASLAERVNTHQHIKLYPFSCDVAFQPDLLKSILNKFTPDYLIHAAALKHVGEGERNQATYLAVNTIGSQIVNQVAVELGIPIRLFISTDKAVDPINFYGRTKMLAEDIWDGAVIRFGNIIDARGGILSRWMEGEQIVLRGKPTRFVLFSHEAADLILSLILDCELMARKRIFVPTGLQAISIEELARSFARHITFENLPPYEKEHEVLIGCYEQPTDRVVARRLVEIQKSNQFTIQPDDFISERAPRMSPERLKDEYTLHCRNRDEL